MVKLRGRIGCLLAVAALLAGCTSESEEPRADSTGTAPATATPSASPSVAPLDYADWHWLSKGRVELRIPPGWGPVQCRANPIYDVFMGGWPAACDKGSASLEIGFPLGGQEGQDGADPEPVDINGESALRYDFERPEAGRPSVHERLTLVEFPQRKADVLLLNAPDALVDGIVASIRFVTRTHDGCRTVIPHWQPIQMRRLRPATAHLPGNPRQVRVCAYNRGLNGESTTLAARVARHLVREINAAEPGWGPPHPRCPGVPNYESDFLTPWFDILLIYPRDRTVHQIAQKHGCDNFGVQHGPTVSHFTQAIHRTLSEPFNSQSLGQAHQLPLR